MDLNTMFSDQVCFLSGSRMETNLGEMSFAIDRNVQSTTGTESARILGTSALLKKFEVLAFIKKLGLDGVLQPSEPLYLSGSHLG